MREYEALLGALHYFGVDLVWPEVLEPFLSPSPASSR
jgi:hypothetical protein